MSQKICCVSVYSHVPTYPLQEHIDRAQEWAREEAIAEANVRQNVPGHYIFIHFYFFLLHRE